MPVTLLLAASFNWWRGPTQFLSLTEEKRKKTQYQFQSTLQMVNLFFLFLYGSFFCSNRLEENPEGSAELVESVENSDDLNRPQMDL